jgi:hypothetical protein
MPVLQPIKCVNYVNCQNSFGRLQADTHCGYANRTVTSQSVPTGVVVQYCMYVLYIKKRTERIQRNCDMFRHSWAIITEYPKILRTALEITTKHPNWKLQARQRTATVHRGAFA